MAKGTVNVPSSATNSSNNHKRKLYLIGASSQNRNARTYSNEKCYVGEDDCLYSNGQIVATSEEIGKINTILDSLNGEVV